MESLSLTTQSTNVGLVTMDNANNGDMVTE
jgi:hypothetical protein